eukprot:CAMPEP_0202686520 /NCGR_PEP_ID=MMETSP1385-20130828/2267_1 /ASSEMBLY_ACC=CAM_ASM_000861 /TAXON_ID=933848 /ORGANISM="Elphidium margaritaceum" /LENGTH=561 /DNA_ID=CAMNT_0049341109 /DNA_START=20 /DNA_END=1705 /DNA_ORIENTATION=+
MGTNNSKNENSGGSSTEKPKPMKYKRQFSSDAARSDQKAMFDNYVQTTDSATTKSAVGTDVKKYTAPPSPMVNDENPTSFGAPPKAKTSIAEEDDDQGDNDSKEMTDAEEMMIKKSTERALSPGTNLVDENDVTDTTGIDDEQKQENNASSAPPKQISTRDTMEVPSDDALIKQISNHDRMATKSIAEIDAAALQAIHEPLLWGYCELTRKQLDEDQAAFLTWTHPTDGFVHAWAIFDGHGGYETALYAAQHFLKYVQKYHLTRKDMATNATAMEQWKDLLQEIFVKFDQHIGHLNIRGGSTVVVVLLIGRTVVCANAGDARAIMSSGDGQAVELSRDHTPMADYDRLAKLARQKSHYKKISKFFRINAQHETYADVQKLSSTELRKAPFISREMDKSRLLGTIGVARGFGDYGLTVFGFKSIAIKPYLSAEPYVVIKELNEADIGDTDLLCVACDGVFDVMSNQEVIDLLRKEIFFRKRKNSKEDGNENEKEEKQDGHEQQVDASSYMDDPNLDIDTQRIDKSCAVLGLRAYAKGTMDDVSIFCVPLKQICEFYKLTNAN